MQIQSQRYEIIFSDLMFEVFIIYYTLKNV